LALRLKSTDVGRYHSTRLLRKDAENVGKVERGYEDLATSVTDRKADFIYFVETKNKNLATVGNILTY
jgi:hypothetical protein